MDKKKTCDFNQEEYMAYLTTLDLDELAAEQGKQEKILKDLEDEYQQNRNYINKYIDKPQFEHLIEMSMQEAPQEIDLMTQRLKIKLIIDDFKSRFENMR